MTAPAYRRWATWPRRDREWVRARDEGSVSIWVVTGGLVMIILVGLAVDLGGQVYTRQRAQDVAAQAARAGGQQLVSSQAVRGGRAAADPAEAIAAATAYLAAAPDVTGTVNVMGGDTIEVTTQATYSTTFLGVLGISSLDVTGSAQARITRSLGGIEQ